MYGEMVLDSFNLNIIFKPIIIIRKVKEIIFMSRVFALFHFCHYVVVFKY